MDYVTEEEFMQSSCSHPSSLWGLRLAVGLIVLANLLTFAVIEGGYSHGKSIFKFSTLGAFYLILMAVVLFRRLRTSPADGMLLGVSLSLVGAAANLTSHVDVVEVFGAITAMIVGPLTFLVYAYFFLRENGRSKEGGVNST